MRNTRELFFVCVKKYELQRGKKKDFILNPIKKTYKGENHVGKMEALNVFN